MSEMSIGQLSERSGIKVPTIRYYEQIGILPEPPRTQGNQRRYGRATLDRLNFVGHARAMGFPMTSVRALLEIAAHPEQPCHQLDDLVEDRLAEVERRLQGLEKLKTELTAMLRDHRHGRVGECRIVEVLSDHAACGPDHGHDVQ